MRVIVLMGGTSTERAVSHATGMHVAGALRLVRHEVAELDVPTALMQDAYDVRFTSSRTPDAPAVDIPRDPPTLDQLAQLSAEVEPSARAVRLLAACRQADVVFIALHGGLGEDGTLQALFELAGIPYTGADPLGCSLAFNKPVAKALLKASGVPTPDWRVVGAAEERGVDPGDWPFPIVIKPSKGGSTVGVSLASNPGDLRAKVVLTRRFGGDVMLERFVEGAEYTVGVFAGKALPVVEIRFPGRIFDYEAKYQPRGAEELCPAPIEEGLTRELQTQARAACAALRIGLDAYARVDFRADADGAVYCLEANVLPGLTPASLMPLAVRASGMEFPEFCDQAVHLALSRAHRPVDGRE